MMDALDDPLARTPLTELHIESGGRMVGFAGYEMPLQFRSGVLSEHRWTRQSAGQFDVSHMGQVALLPRSG
jgi:aminomethyltransferase